MAKYTYSVEVQHPGGDWYPIMREAQRGHCEGYAWSHRDQSPPRLPIRVCRSDGQVIEEYAGDDEVALGMLVGMPTAEMYEAAAARALEKASQIRRLMKAHSGAK